MFARGRGRRPWWDAAILVGAVGTLADVVALPAGLHAQAVVTHVHAVCNNIHSVYNVIFYSSNSHCCQPSKQAATTFTIL